MMVRSRDLRILVDEAAESISSQDPDRVVRYRVGQWPARRVSRSLRQILQGFFESSVCAFWSCSVGWFDPGRGWYGGRFRVLADEPLRVAGVRGGQHVGADRVDRTVM
jgi:hypothetical protein